jgi:hypothetical protein
MSTGQDMSVRSFPALRPAPQSIPRPRSLPWENICLHPVPTGSHGVRGDPRISIDINKIFTFFGQNYDSVDFIFSIFVKKKQIFSCYFLKNKNNT